MCSRPNSGSITGPDGSRVGGQVIPAPGARVRSAPPRPGAPLVAGAGAGGVPSPVAAVVGGGGGGGVQQSRGGGLEEASMGMIGGERGRAGGFLWLNRPEQHNALSAELGAQLIETLHGLAHDDSVRVLVVGGRGPSFCAG